MAEGCGPDDIYHHKPEPKKQNILFRSSDFFYDILDGPVTWFRKNIVEPNQKKYPWYHQEFRRVKTIDECYTDDYACYYEADSQFGRDKKVDNEILSILRYRMDDCVREEFPDYLPCLKFKEDYEVAAANWFSKYGDLGGYGDVKTAYLKQKHRMLWERRHGPIGCGMKKDTYEVEDDMSH